MEIDPKPPPEAELIPAKLTLPAIRQAPGAGPPARVGGTVGHLTLESVARVAAAAGRIAREGRPRGRPNAGRDELLVLTLFDPALRISEALGLRPCDIVEEADHPRLRIVGKGRKRGVVSVSESLARRLKAYAYDKKLGPEERFFPITRGRAHQIVDRAFKAAGVAKPDHVGTLHVLRHSGAIERLRATGNPRAVQEQLRHASPAMTLKYLRTLAAEEAMRVQDQVDFRW